MSSLPTRFGKYQLLEKIASGGMAEIFKARLDGISGFHRTVAIKRILPHLSANPEFVDMLVDEAKIAGVLSHANIVQIIDFGQVEGQYYIGMEYVHGRDLGQLIRRCEEKGITLPVPHAVYILVELLKGLEYAHTRQLNQDGKVVPLNLVHRDISPANILVSFQGEVKITDYGIAKASIKALETMSGVVKGRFDYMSPEQANGRPVDQRSDLFSAGVLLYLLLTGQHPFRQAGELATVEAIRRGEFRPASQVNPDVPAALDRVVERALQVDPQERFQSASAFRAGLDRFFSDAGFLFSASTLAAFVRVLFPEGVSAARAAPASAPAPEPSLVPGDEELSLPEPGAAEDWGDVKTLVKDAPKPHAPPPKPPALKPTPPPAPPKPLASKGESTATLPPVEASRAPAPAPPRVHARPSPPPATGRVPVLVHVAWLALAGFSLVVGFVVGLAVDRLLLSPSAAPKEPPRLLLLADEGTQVEIDGKALQGPPYQKSLAPGAAHAVRVVAPSKAPVELSVTLEPDQTRVLDFRANPAP